MLRSKASNNQLSGRHSGSQSDLLDVDHAPRPSSRLSSFSHFRRSSLLPTLSNSNLASTSFNQKSTSHVNNALERGGVDDVPTMAASKSTAKAPNKPPKPPALRVKKVKALSISLLTPNNSKNHSNTSESSGASQLQPHSAHSAMPSTLQEALAAEDESGGRYPSRDVPRQPSRSASALDLYRTHGPMKGLLSGGGHVTQRMPNSAGLGVPPKSASAAQGVRDKTFPISSAETADQPASASLRKRRSNSFSLSNLASARIFSSDKTHNQKSVAPPWNLDTARELLAAGSQQFQPEPQPLSTPPMSSMHASSPNLLKATAHGATASPFLNKFSVRAKLDNDNGNSARPGHNKNPSSFDSASTASSPSSPLSRIPRYKSSTSHLGKADILRSTHRPSTESISSGYQSPNDRSSPMRSNALSRSSGGSRPSTSPYDSANASPKANYKIRARTQSHAANLSLPHARRAEEMVLPRHPLSTDVGAASRGAPGQSSFPAPPKRNILSRVSTYDALQSTGNSDMHGLRPGTAMSGSTTATGPSLHHISQQIGGMGAAVGKRGWDMFKQWSATSGPSTTRKGPVMMTSMSQGNDLNAATRAWIAVLNNASERIDANGVFGRPLRDAVLLTRLGGSSVVTHGVAGNNDRQTSIAMDLGSEFKIEMADIDTSPHQVHSPLRSLACSREVARLKYLPGVVVRCIQAIESSGLDEEGLYRLSGRSTHTSKLRQIFNTLPTSVRNGKPFAMVPSQTCISDLCLADISPADMDLNSITSLLKAYLRELPHPLIPEPLGSELNRLLERECGVSAVGIGAQFGAENDAKAIKIATSTPQKDRSEDNVRIARLVSGPLSSLPPANWYLLRELAMHLCDLIRPEVVARTRMPLNNLCLVLAPTLSLSVPMMQAMVSAREEMFCRAGPAADGELDRLELNRVHRPSVSALRSTFAPTLNPALLSPRIRADEEGGDEKRSSVSTLTGKRESVSSVATVQARTPLFSTTAPFAASYDERVSKTLLEEDDGEFVSSPIAAKFIRKRNGSIAGSLSQSTFGSDSSSIRRPSASGSTPKLPQQESLIALDRTSNDHSSGPPSADGFSSAASSLTPSISSSSLRTSSALAFASDAFHTTSSTTTYPSSGNGSIDRPRPPTGASAKFMGGRLLGKERSGASAHHRHSRTGSQMGVYATVTQPSDVPTLTPPPPPPTVYHHLARHDVEEGDETIRASPTIDKLIDDSPMNVGAVRDYWNVQSMV